MRKVAYARTWVWLIKEKQKLMEEQEKISEKMELKVEALYNRIIERILEYWIKKVGEK